jgi:hypothetical protein
MLDHCKKSGERLNVPADLTNTVGDLRSTISETATEIRDRLCREKAEVSGISEAAANTRPRHHGSGASNGRSLLGSGSISVAADQKLSQDPESED